MTSFNSDTTLSKGDFIKNVLACSVPYSERYSDL